MFYYNYVALCNKLGRSPSAVAEEMGFQRSVVTRWSKGTVPRQATLQRIADFFGVTVDELLEDNKKAPTPEGERLDDVYLSFARQAQEEGIEPEDIQLAIETIRKLRGNRNNNA